MRKIGFVIAVASLVFSPLVWWAEPAEDPVKAQDNAQQAQEPLLRMTQEPALARPGKGVLVQGPSGRQWRIHPEILQPQQRRIRPGAPEDRELSPCLAQAPGGRAQVLGEPDPCDVGAILSEMTPCLAQEDCESFQLWRLRMGDPELRQVAPRRAQPPVFRRAAPRREE